jgi:hypothetical protein
MDFDKFAGTQWLFTGMCTAEENCRFCYVLLHRLTLPLTDSLEADMIVLEAFCTSEYEIQFIIHHSRNM